ncbi:MAG: ATP-binding cassette domain-containing protein [Flavobacteriales bacterium]|jgi:putative ABC transport system ATP-binding protein|nr:ATP-binding cassette domain-containing protein [Flavobacteriales bacterium]
MLTTNNLEYSYPNGPTFRFPDLSVDSRDVQLILGASGKGKTTLLHLLAGLMNAESGTVELKGSQLRELKGSARDRFRGNHIGIIFQQAQFIRSITIMQNLQLARTLAGLKQNLNIAKDLLDELGIGDKADLYPQSLSIGERQRASIARALITSPDVVLADEPTSSLDDRNCQKVADLLQKTVTGHNAALVIVTHDRRLKDRFPNSVEI